MLSQAQIDQFNRDGYLVVEDLITQPVREAVKAEYEELLDALYAGWQSDGLVPKLAADATFWDKLDVAIKGGFDWYQPFDISLPHDNITNDTPMHLDQLSLTWSPVIASWTLLNV